MIESTGGCTKQQEINRRGPHKAAPVGFVIGKAALPGVRGRRGAVAPPRFKVTI